VQEGTLIETDAGVEFTVFDGAHEVHIVHVGAPPELFREGVGAIVEGSWDGEVFRSDELVVKHDEQYQAPEDEGHPYEVPTDA
jgi:cytochrome c-type biogenesis protein CcmE